MTSNFLTTFLSAASIAGIAVIWRNWLFDHPSWKSWLELRLKAAHKVFTCGSCFTYWLALAYALIERPLTFWTSNIFLQWMALAWLAVFLRFLYVGLQEHVHILVHKRDDHS